MPRSGPTPEDVIGIVAEAGGFASLAHPGLLHVPVCIATLARRGLAAVEAYHSDHDTAQRARYVKVAKQAGLGVSGGSDFHGEDASRPRALGGVSLPRRHYEGLLAIARARQCAAVPRRVLAE